jgi:hypothetical protein
MACRGQTGNAPRWAMHRRQWGSPLPLGVPATTTWAHSRSRPASTQEAAALSTGRGLTRTATPTCTQLWRAQAHSHARAHDHNSSRSRARAKHELYAQGAKHTDQAHRSSRRVSHGPHDAVPTSPHAQQHRPGYTGASTAVLSRQARRVSIIAHGRGCTLQGRH